MTVEQLHDALTQLPDDLIAGADARRIPKPRIIPFKRYAALAASFAVVVACGLFCMYLLSPKGAKESMKEMELAVASIGGADSAAAQGTEAPASAEPAALEPQAAAAMEESGNTTAFNGEHREESAAEDSPAEALPQEDAAISLTDIQYVPTPVNPASSVNTGGDPRTRLLSSREDLDAYLDDMQAMFLMDDFRDACSRYDETWFASHDLLVLRIGAATEEHRFEVTGLKRLNDSQFPAWELSLNLGPVADKAFDGISMWHILMEVDKSILTEEDTIILDLEATP